MFHLLGQAPSMSPSQRSQAQARQPPSQQPSPVPGWDEGNFFLNLPGALMAEGREQAPAPRCTSPEPEPWLDWDEILECTVTNGARRADAENWLAYLGMSTELFAALPSKQQKQALGAAWGLHDASADATKFPPANGRQQPSFFAMMCADRGFFENIKCDYVNSRPEALAAHTRELRFYVSQLARARMAKGLWDREFEKRYRAKFIALGLDGGAAGGDLALQCYKNM